MAYPQTSTHNSSVDSSSPSTSTTTGYYYDVFLNHRGPDVKNTFVSHLYYRLLSHGLQAFLDREELRAGEHLTPQIESAIRSSSVHITIFSPRYAQSKWCMDELVLILKSGGTIIPVFYNVKPSELRRMDKDDGMYAQAFSYHEQKCRYTRQRLENWRKALSEVSYLVGFELEACNGDEGKLLDKVVECVLKNRRKIALNVATYPTGLQEKVEDFEMTMPLQQQSGKVQILGIVGLGGVGKTTLAKELFNRKRSDFGKSYFLFDVREAAGIRSLNSLQSKLLNGLTHSNLQIDSVDEGIEMLRQCLSSSHALVVLDDVNNVHQLEAFLPIKDVLRPDSLILITSRDKDVLTTSGLAESSIYMLTGLDEQHSLQLFCSYAFCQPHPKQGFEHLVDEFCKACAGLPFSLKVFGGLLREKNDQSYWKGQLDKIRQIKIPNEIHQTLKISYDALDPEEQQIFLDIACYFIGEDRDMAIRIWDGSGWKGSVGLLNLENKCLVEVNRENNRIKMHDQLRDFGRNIAEEEKPPNRLWRPTDGFHDLKQQSTQVITEVRGIRTDPGYQIPELEQVSSFKSWAQRVFRICGRRQIDTTSYRFTNLQLLSTEGAQLESILRRVDSPNLIWLRWNNCPYSALPSRIPMKNIRVLEVEGNQLKILWLTESQAPLELRELNINSPLLEFPKSIGLLKHIEKIVVTYELPEFINLRTLPKEFCLLRSLKYLHLSCPDMESLPDSFGYLTNLEHLHLSCSKSLRVLPNSFGNLTRLKHLNLQRCCNLTMSEEIFANVRMLEYLELSGCKKVEVLPTQVVHQSSLQVLRLFNTCLKKLPRDIGKLSSLEFLSLESPFLELLPPSLGHLNSLKELRLLSCRNLKCLPDSLGLLTGLSTLSIQKCGLSSLQPEIVKINNLVKLIVTECPLRELSLKKLVEGERETGIIGRRARRRELGKLASCIDRPQNPCMHRLEYLELDRTKISKISFDEGVCPNLKYLHIFYCHDLVEVAQLPPTLIKLELVSCSQVRKIEGLRNLTKLRELNIIHCEQLQALPSLERLPQLTKIQISNMDNCYVWEQAADVKAVRSLEKLCVEELVAR